MFPTMQEGRVIAVDIPNRRLTVELPSTQAVQVRMGYHGPADGARVSHKAMPGLGTWGLVAFPCGDNRAGVWLCSHYPAFADALTTENDQFMDYDAHWSGAYELMNGVGEWCKSFPDGTFLQVSGAVTKPTTYRHTVDENQNQQFVQFPDSQRIPSPPSPRYLYVNHASGTNATIDPSGNTTVNGAKSASCTIEFNNAFIKIDQNGGVEINAASGQNVKVSAGNGATSYTLVRTDLFLAAFNNHKHPSTGVPTVQLTAANVQSTMQDVSE